MRWSCMDEPFLIADAICSGAPRRVPAPAARLARPALLDVGERGREQIELLLPVFGIAIEPHRRRMGGASVEAAAADAPRALLAHQPRAHQHLDMARDRLERDLEGCCEF